MSTQIEATFDISGWKETPFDDGVGVAKLAEAFVTKQYSVGIDGLDHEMVDGIRTRQVGDIRRYRANSGDGRREARQPGVTSRWKLPERGGHRDLAHRVGNGSTEEGHGSRHVQRRSIRVRPA